MSGISFLKARWLHDFVSALCHSACDTYRHVLHCTRPLLGVTAKCSSCYFSCEVSATSKNYSWKSQKGLLEDFGNTMLHVFFSANVSLISRTFWIQSALHVRIVKFLFMFLKGSVIRCLAVPLYWIWMVVLVSHVFNTYMAIGVPNLFCLSSPFVWQRTSSVVSFIVST